MAARIAMLSNKLGGGKSSTSGSSEPEPPKDKPIQIETAASSNVAKMDMSKLINKMNKEQQSTGKLKSPPKLKIVN